LAPTRLHQASIDLTAKTGVSWSTPTPTDDADADADGSFVGGQVIDAVWDRFADCIGREVVDVHQVGLALRLPLAFRRS
jgi:hypothetical protein